MILRRIRYLSLFFVSIVATLSTVSGHSSIWDFLPTWLGGNEQSPPEEDPIEPVEPEKPIEKVPPVQKANPENFSELEAEDPLPKCVDILGNFKREIFYSLPLIDWFNSTNIGTFFQPTLKRILTRENCFANYNSLNEINLWLEPFGFYAKHKEEHLPFDLQTFGIGLGGSYTLSDHLYLGAGAGYLHSKSNWDKEKIPDTTVNALYLGPYFGYLAEKGYVSIMVVGIKNFYNIGKALIYKESQKHKTDSHESWDILARIDGGIDCKMPEGFTKNFFIQPNTTLDYLNIFQDSCEEKHFSIDRKYLAFLRVKIALQLRKEIFTKDKNCFIPSISFGWNRMMPLSNEKIHGKIKETICNPLDLKKEPSIHYKTSNQLLLAIKLAGVHHKGMLFSLSYEAYLGEPYQVHLGRLRFEWDW